MSCVQLAMSPPRPPWTPSSAFAGVRWHPIRIPTSRVNGS